MSELANIEKLIAEVRRNWNVMLQENFNPISVALEMLNRSNPSYNHESFIRLNEELDVAMESIVDKYYTGFNSAVATFSGISDNLNFSKKIVSEELGNIEDFRDQISYRREDLPSIWQKIEKLKETMTCYEKIEHVRKIRVQTLELTQRKFYIPSARLLSQALHLLKADSGEKEELAPDMIRILKKDVEVLFENMMDDFFYFLFLKDKNTNPLLFAKATQSLPSLKDMDVDFTKEWTKSTVTIGDGDLVLAPTEFNFDPTSNGLSFILSIVHAAAVINMLPKLVSSVKQRCPSELYQLTEADLRATMKKYSRQSNFSKFDYSTGPVFFLPIATSSRSDRIEYESFSPLLRVFFTELLVKFLLVASTTRLVDMEISKQAQVYNCNMADIEQLLFTSIVYEINTEIKNVIGTFVHGSKHAQKIYPASTYQLSEILRGAKAIDKIQTKKQTMFHLNLPSEEVSESVKLPSLTGLLTERERSIAFNTAKLIVPDPFSTNKEQFGHKPIVKPNLQYMFILFGIFSTFQSWISQL